MATREEVRTDMKVRLYIDSPERLFQAGPSWEQQPLGFYYDTDQGVDIAMKRIMLNILAREGKSLPNNRWNQLRAGINRDTIVSDAIDIITNIAAFAS